MYTVHLDVQFVQTAVDLACKHFPNEVGTALVGSYTDDGWQATVCDVAPITPDSKGGRSWFTRGLQGLRGFFAGIFTETKGRTHYVGEWHSHPGGDPVPSPTDDQNMMDIVKDPTARCSECILVIVGLGSDHVESAVYIYSAARGRVDLTIADNTPTKGD